MFVGRGHFCPLLFFYLESYDGGLFLYTKIIILMKLQGAREITLANSEHEINFIFEYIRASVAVAVKHQWSSSFSFFIFSSYIIIEGVDIHLS